MIVYYEVKTMSEEKEEFEEEEIEEEEKEEEENLVEQLRPQEKEMIVLNLVIRTSDGYYNYKSIVYAVFKEPEEVRYEDSYVMNIRTKTIYCGVYQPYNCFNVELVFQELEKQGYKIVKIFEA